MSKKSLQERINESTKRAAPSMVPEGIKPKEKKVYESEVLPDIREVLPPKEALAIMRYAALDVDLQMQAREIRAARKPLGERIKEILAYKPTKFMVGTNRLTAFKMKRSSIDANKLMNLGVSIATIKAATVTKEVLTLKITPPEVEGKEDEDGDD